MTVLTNNRRWMRRALQAGAPLVVLSATVWSQQVAVSPAAYRDRWAANVADQWSLNVNSAARYLQIHTDVPAMAIQQIAWRPHPRVGGPQTTYSMELWIGEGSYEQRSATFLANFTGAPTRALVRRNVQFPAFSVPTTIAAGDAFVLRVPLDQPWAYTRARDLVLMWDTFSGGAYELDTAASQRPEDVQFGAPQGVGCYNTYNNALAILSGQSVASRGLMQHRLSLTGSGLRPNSITTTLLGASSVAISYPFLCTFQYVDSVFHAWLGVSDGSGVARIALVTSFVPELAGLIVHSQSYCLDDGRHPSLLPVTVTNGLRIQIADILPPWVSACLNAGSPAGAQGSTWGPRDLVFVTQFR